MAATATAGILVRTIGITGAGGKFSGLLFALAADSLFPALLVTMIVCVILGMGMPVPSAYILTAVVAGPALVGLGVPVIAAHLFIVYFAVLSAITPPVAVAAFAAAGITGGSANAIGYKAVKLGVVAFIVPFVFVYQPALLLQDRYRKWSLPRLHRPSVWPSSPPGWRDGCSRGWRAGSACCPSLGRSPHQAWNPAQTWLG
ncbi:MAG: TRAP transporter large permease subunit [Vicinamibacterales bacterium]|nr:TRAP transporter large permease subunit [Vicinamibacterales bacterium]